MIVVKDEKGRILSSGNPKIIKMWESAGYEKVTLDKNGNVKNARRAGRKG